MEEKLIGQNTTKPNSLKQKKLFSKIGLCFFVGTMIITGLQLGLGNLFSVLFPKIYEKYAFLVMMLPMYIIAIPIIVFMLTRIRPVATIEKAKLGVKEILGFFLVSYAGMYISNIIGNYLASVIAIVKQGKVNNVITQVATGNDWWMNVLIMVICAPIAEELLFRKNRSIWRKTGYHIISADVCILSRQYLSVLLCICVRLRVWLCVCQNRKNDLYHCFTYDD